MSFALVRKELREHGIVLVTTLLLGGIVLLGLLVQAGESYGGRFFGLTRFSLFFAPLLTLVLANRLIVREYAGRTQLYLETLPIGRLRVFVTKWLLGAGFSVGVAALGVWAAWSFTRTREIVAFADALGPALAIVMFWLTVWSFAALGGMLGRYRYVVWGALLAVLYLATSVAGIPFDDLPVARLLGEDVQMMAVRPENAAFVQAFVVFAVCTTGAALLALLGSGGIASTLAKRMTARERVFVLVTLLTVMTVGSMLEPQPDEPPFAIAEGERVDGRFSTVGVMPTADLDAPTARALAATVAADVDELVETLALDERPPVFLLPQQGIDPYMLQRAALRGAHGVVLKMAPDSPRDMVRTLVVHSILSDATLNRAMREDRHVLLDGFAAYWALRDDPDARSLWWLRAASLDTPLTAATLTEWSATSEQLGECLALAVAFNVFATLESRLGREPTIALMRRWFATPAGDARVLFERRPVSLLAEYGLDWPSLAAAAETARQEARIRHDAVLAQRPVITAAVDYQRSPERGTEIETLLDGALPYSVYYAQIGPWTDDIGGLLPRLDVRGRRGVLPLSPPAGARVLVAIELDDAVLDCPTRVLAERLQIE